VRQASESAIIAMCNHSAFGVSPCITAIIKTGNRANLGPKTAKKAMNSNKLIINRYQTLARILAEVPNIPEDQLYASLDFASEGLQHAL